MVVEKKIYLAVCDNFMKEFQKVISDEDLDMVKVLPLACSCLQGRQRTEDSQVLSSCNREECSEIHLFQCRGNTPRADDETPDSGPEIVRNILDNCFELFADKEFIAQKIEGGGYLTTPGWVVNWMGHLDRWGFNQEAAQEFYAEFAKEIILLDTGIFPEAPMKCREFAEYLGLPFKIEQIGLGHLTLKVKNVVLNWQLEKAQLKVSKIEKDLARQSAEMATTLDFLAELTSKSEEAEVLKTISHLFSALFGPEHVAVASVLNGQIIEENTIHCDCGSNELFMDLITNMEGDYKKLPDKNGFAIRLGHGDITNGMVVVSGLAFPRKMTAYLSQALNLSLVCSLAIANSRALRGYLPICSYCKKIRKPNGQWQQMESYISDHTQALFSHTYCQECLDDNLGDIMEK